jgi:hypothetical protein
VISGISPKDRAISQSVNSDEVPVISGVSQDEDTDDSEAEKSLSETEPVQEAQVEDPFFAELIAKSSEQKEEE